MDQWAHRREFRQRVAHHDIPKVCLWAGGIVIAMALTNALRTGLAGGSLWLNLPLGLILLAIGLAMRSPRFPDSAVSPTFAVVAVALCGSLSFQAAAYEWPVDLGYAIVVISVFGPVVLDVRSFALATPLMLIAYGLGVQHVTGDGWVSWFLVGVSAALASAGLLGMRLSALVAQADAAREVEQLATTDRLTGVLNRHGLDVVLPQVLSSVARFGSTVYVCFIDVDGLKAANDTHGHDFGDEVLRCVARALEASIREGDVLARWGGDEFVIIGLGTESARDVIEPRILEHVRGCGIDPAKWPGFVSTGFAQGAARGGEVADLISRADQDMYRRRAERRVS